MFSICVIVFFVLFLFFLFVHLRVIDNNLDGLLSDIREFRGDIGLVCYK